jgi:hypothetical protein
MGTTEINEGMMEFFNNCITFQQFSGAIVAKDNQAYYLLGKLNSKYLFLDPHKVSKGDKLKNYEVKTLYKIDFHDLHPNMSMAFRIGSI